MKNRLAFVSSRSLVFSAFFGALLTTGFAFKALKDKPACAIALLKQNVFYIGVDNPISIVTRGIPEDQLIIDAQGLELKKGEGDNYIVRATSPGTGTIIVSGGDMVPMTFKFRVKRIPDPVVVLGGKYKSGTMGNGAFKTPRGIAVVLENFDFEAQCNVISYEVTYLGKRQDPITSTNTGARFNSNVQDFINKAKPGDGYFFDDVKVKCPGDLLPRNLGGMAFRIK